MGRLIILLSVALVLTGCVYSHRIQPLMTDFASTPSGDERNAGDVKSVSYYVSVEWDENGIGDIARKNGLEEVFYADLEIISVLGYWEQRRVHIYGR